MDWTLRCGAGEWMCAQRNIGPPRPGLTAAVARMALPVLRRKSEIA
jgi:hypothetical protein